jgi:hypothetical protein
MVATSVSGNVVTLGWSANCTVPVTLTGTISSTNGTSFCQGSTTVFSVTPIAGADGYSWTLPAGCIITAGFNSNAITVTMGSTSGNVTCAATNNCGQPGTGITLAVAAYAQPTLSDVAFGIHRNRL